MGDAGLSANLRVGAFGQLDGDQIQNYAFQRAATLHLADAWHIPAPTTAEITEQIKTLRMFAGQDGQFDAKAYQTFRDNLKTNPRGVREADILRVVADDVRADVDAPSPLRARDFFCCSSTQRSFTAASDGSACTAALTHSARREPSATADSDSPNGVRCSSRTNCVSCECVREQKMTCGDW